MQNKDQVQKHLDNLLHQEKYGFFNGRFEKKTQEFVGRAGLTKNFK